METKICIKCNLEKDINLFYKCGNYKGKINRLNECKPCANIKKLAYQKLYRELNKDKINAKKRKYYSIKMEDIEFVEKVNDGQRRRYSRYVYNRLLSNCKKRALNKGLEFNLTADDIEIPLKCPILEIYLITGTKDNYNSSPSVDRLDNSKGYIKGNIRIISTLANTMKNSATKEQLLLFCKNIPEYLMNKEIVQPIEK